MTNENIHQQYLFSPVAMSIMAKSNVSLFYNQWEKV
jgi:hypothetical protein